MKTPDYITTAEHQVRSGTSDTRTLPAGSFVRPVSYQYVPKHVQEDPQWRYCDKDTYVFVYCRWGFIMIPKTGIREA